MKLFYNGVIHTMDQDAPQVEALLVDEGRIQAVETLDELTHRGAEEVNLRGGTLLPAFNDAHIHVSWLGLQLTQWLDARNHVSPDIPSIPSSPSSANGLFLARQAVYQLIEQNIGQRQPGLLLGEAR